MAGRDELPTKTSYCELQSDRKYKNYQRTEREEEPSMVVNKSQFHGEIRTYKRRHVLRTPQIVITCPADNLKENFICKACSSGPLCCVDQPDSQMKDFAAVSQQEAIDYNNSNDESDYEGTRTCSECGSTISSNSDCSSASSDDGQDSINSIAPSLRKYTSRENVSKGCLVPKNDVLSEISKRDQGSSNETSSSESSSSEDEDEEIILVHIDRELKNVVDNHIRSRQNSLNSSDDAESFEECRSSSPTKDIPNSKESEILQKFLQQVGTHPQEEDLDVILEIVGEEEEEPCNRSIINIRECTEKFKDIYARKLREIYHKRYQGAGPTWNVSKRDAISNDRTDAPKSNNDPNASKPENDSKRLHDNPQKIKTELVQQIGSTKMNYDLQNNNLENPNEVPRKSCSEIYQYSGFATNQERFGEDSNSSLSDDDRAFNFGVQKTNRRDETMIDKLPEIRRFHPQNNDDKISFEDKTYLKATSLINEIESCFRETAFLVEKSIGSYRAPVKVYRNEIETKERVQPPSPDPIFIDKDVGSRDSSGYTNSSFERANNDRITNEYLSFWNTTDYNSQSLMQCEFVTQRTPSAEPSDKELSLPNKVLRRSQGDAQNIDTERVPRTLEESIEIFEMILGDRKNESRKSYDSGLSSSTLVLNSSRFFKENSLEPSKNFLKCNSTFDLPSSMTDNKSLDQSWSLNRSRNKFKSSLTLEGRSRTLSGSRSDNSPNSTYTSAHFQNLNSAETEMDESNTYKKFDNFDCYDELEDDSTTSLQGDGSKWKKHTIVSPCEAMPSETRKIKKPLSTKMINHNVNHGNYVDALKPTALITQNDQFRENMLHQEIAESSSKLSNNPLYRWKSEPDFGRLPYPSFGFQSSIAEEYYDQDYLATSMTTFMKKMKRETVEDTIQTNHSLKEETVQVQIKNDEASIENETKLSSGETMGILSDQPLFAQVDELLRGLCESRLDGGSESDEGVVSDQSDFSDSNLTSRAECYSASEIMTSINGSNGDRELEKNIEQIVHGINSIKEKHLGKKIEEELENFIRPKIELLRNNINCNLRSSANSTLSQPKYSAISLQEKKRYFEEEEDLSEKIKQLAELPEIREIITSMNQQSTKSLWKLQVSNELTAMEQISQASDELKSLGLVPSAKCLNETFKSITSGQRCSRKEEYQRKMITRRFNKSSDYVNTTKTSRSSSCFSYFEETDSGGGSDLSDCITSCENPTRRRRNHDSTFHSESTESNRNSFIMKMLHQNLRCYVITLAFLEKLLNGQANQQDAANRDKFFEKFDAAKSEISSTGFEALEKAMAMLPEITESATSNPEAHKLSPFAIGHEAFLKGLQRKHLLETERNS